MLLALTVNSIHAIDANDTVTAVCQSEDADILADSDSVEVPDDSGAVFKPDAKSYTDLAKKINKTKENSVLVLKDSYKYDSERDSQYESGITVSKNIKIVGKNDCSIDGGGKARILNIQSGCKVTLKDITFKNGYQDRGNGGAILLNSKSKLYVYGCNFKNNKVYRANGGAIAGFEKTTLEIHDCKFYNNKAVRGSDKKWPADKRGMGAALNINIGSSLKIYDSAFKKNQAYLSTVLLMSHTDSGTKTSGAYVKHCLFENNTSNYNGVFYLDEYGKGKFLKCVFKKNRSLDKGGTLILDASLSAVVKNCKFIENKGVFGAAIDIFKFKKSVSTVSIIGCLFSKNKAKDAGGAIFSEFAKLKILKSKFVGNKASVSGGAVEVRGGTLNIVKALFKINHAQCGGALLIKNKKGIHLIKSKFVKNRASVNGHNVLGIFNHKVFKLKIYKK